MSSGGASPGLPPAAQEATTSASDRAGTSPPPPQPQTQEQQIQLIAPDGSTAPQEIQLTGPDGSRPGATATAGLLEEAPAFKAPPAAGDEEVAPARQVANQADAMTPVAPQEDMMFGAVPMPEQSGLEGLLDESPPRRQFAMEDPNPTKPVDTKSQARYGQAGPQYSYQTAGTWTSSTPSYSYKRV